MSATGVDRHALDSGPGVVAFAPRERTRTYLRQRLPRRRARIVFARSADEVASHFRRGVVDLAIIDVGSGGIQCERAAALARMYPSAGFVALAAWRTSDAPMLARCAELDFDDLLAEGIDDALLAGAVLDLGYSARFSRQYERPPAELGLAGERHTTVWRRLVAHAGRPVRTAELAAVCGLSREHLSRSFARDGGANLKRIIDFVRLLSAAELARNPGYDISTVAHVLGFASGSHLSASAKRLLGVRGSMLKELTGAEMVERVVSGRWSGVGG